MFAKKGTRTSRFTFHERSSDEIDSLPRGDKPRISERDKEVRHDFMDDRATLEIGSLAVQQDGKTSDYDFTNRAAIMTGGTGDRP